VLDLKGRDRRLRDVAVELCGDPIETGDPRHRGRDTGRGDDGRHLEREASPTAAHAATWVPPGLRRAVTRRPLGDDCRRAPDVIDHHADVPIAALGARLERRRDDPPNGR
jgi:hypothetical protein